MASIVSALMGTAGGGLLDGAAKLVNSIKGKNPEDAAKLQELLSKHQDLLVQTDADVERARIQSNVDLNRIASENVKADAQSGDKWTARARPSIIYVGVIILLVNYAVLAFLQKWGFKPIDFPSMFWESWSIVATGVVFTRSGDKIADKVLGGAGGSIQAPFGIKLDSKGD